MQENAVLTNSRAPMRQRRNAYRILMGKPQERKSLGRPRRRWDDNIKIDI
jgi:hypothetical protein